MKIKLIFFKFYKNFKYIYRYFLWEGKGSAIFKSELEFSFDKLFVSLSCKLIKYNYTYILSLISVCFLKWNKNK